MPRWLVRFGVLAGVILVAVGAVIGVRGYLSTSGPDGAVRGYFAALARSDAPAALAFGDVPAGAHDLLTSGVLAEQQRIAPVRSVSVGSVRESGAKATVAVSYTLAFAGAPQKIRTSVGLRERNGDWRLDEVAVPTELLLSAATARAWIAGASAAGKHVAVPNGTTLLFPGAVPIGFDTRYLTVGRAAVTFGADSATDVRVDLTSGARSQALQAVVGMLDRCLVAGGATCPTPGTRYVPGSVRGRRTSVALPDLAVTLAPSSTGVIEVAGRLGVTASYARLGFRDQRITGNGRLSIFLEAKSYAVAPLHFVWRPA